MVTNEERVATFQNELDLIFDKGVKEFTRLCLLAAPSYLFYDCSASSSSKYHPIDELCGEGTLLHTKKVVVVAYTLCRGLDCEESRDEIISACIIHDLVKQGWKKIGHTIKTHPVLAAELVRRVQEDTQILNEKSYKIIYGSVLYHYGPWTVAKIKKPLAEYTPEELTVYISDYVASKREIKVYYKR